jgi:hypothetical protein
MKSHSLPLALAFTVAATTAGCFFLGGNNQPSTGAGAGDSESTGSTGGSGGAAQGPGGSGGIGGATDQAVAQYQALEAQLDKNRMMFLTPGASGLTGIDTHFYWLDFDTFDPHLHSFESTASLTTDYTFGIGDADSYNWRASDQIIVTAENTGDNCVFHVYTIDKANAHVDDVLTDEPGDGVEWWSYSPDGNDLYYVTEEGDTGLWKWTPGGAAPTELFTLESLGVNVGEFEDFIVDSGIMVFIESGRAWSLDLTTQMPVFLGNMTEASGGATLSDGVLIETATGPLFYSYTTKTLRDIAAAIAKNPYKLNSTFASASNYDSDLTNDNHVIGYIGESGLFTFDMDTNKVTPLLLDALDDSTVYASPVFLSDGTVFVQGLQSTDGAIGADGPVYELVNKL